MNILITGGAGFIGSHTADRLIEEGHNVIIFDNLEKQVHNNKIPEYLNKKCDFVLGDVRNKEELKKILKNVDVIYHFAARVGVGQSMYEISDYIETNVMGTANIFDIIVKENIKNIKKIIVASSMSIYGEGAYSCDICKTIVYPQERQIENGWDFVCCNKKMRILPVTESKPLYPNSVYAVSKKDQEIYSLILGKTYKIPVVALRYFNIYGSRQALSNPYTGVCAIFLSNILNNNPVNIYEDGQQLRDFVNIKDIVEANYLAMINDSANYQVFNVGSGSPITICNIADFLMKKLDVKKDLKFISGKYRVGDVRNCIANIDKIKKMLNFEPKYDFYSGCDELINWVKNQKSEDKTSNMNIDLQSKGLLK